MNGLVLIDKPAGCTSHDVVNRWRKLANMKRVGHLGTLDPLATGLLVLLTGTATRLAQFFEKADKTYIAEICFGLASNTFDAEGEVIETGVPTPKDPDSIRAALEQFRGRLLQTPPPVSAKKIKGVPAYKLARKHITLKLDPVEVEIKELEINYISSASVKLTLTCSAGTYVRTLAHDLGQRLGCGAILGNLRRTRVGEFTVEQARTLDQLTALAASRELSQGMIPSGCLLPQFPAEYVDASVEAKIRQGRDFRTSPFIVRPGSRYVRVLSHSGDLIAIGEMKLPNLYHPSIVL